MEGRCVDVVEGSQTRRRRSLPIHLEHVLVLSLGRAGVVGSIVV